MKTKTAPWDYQPRRFNRREHARHEAVYFDARSNRYPINWDNYPEKLRLDWYAVRDAYMRLDAYQGNSNQVKRELHDAIKVAAMQFGTTFDLWWFGKPVDDECTCTPRDEVACPACTATLEKQEIPY